MSIVLDKLIDLADPDFVVSVAPGLAPVVFAPVAGDITIENDEVVGAQVVIDTASITSDSSNRDSYFRNDALKVDQNPTAEFTLDAPIRLPDIGSKAVEVTGEGKLQLLNLEK